ncbi:MAG: glycosyltransferase family 4 protein [Pleurocapsa sp. MO_192.B19]|nr:glycosyltransferase family 4 protein [Pleurocapsa sp. MO_192.B19]
MKFKKILVTGESDIIQRHYLLFKTLSAYVKEFDYLAVDNLSNSRVLKNFVKSIYRKLPFLPEVRASSLRKNSQSFIEKSLRCEQKINQLKYTPELIFHFYGMFSPLWNRWDIPYVTYLDYTMALARKNWLPWAPFPTEKLLNDWIDCERKAYQNARHIFTKSNCAKSSLVKDYDIDSEKITVVYSSGQFLEPYQGEKKIGSKQILFNASDFKRKGGDLVLAAFKEVKQIIPEVKLVVVGERISIDEEGIVNLGLVSSEKIKRLFLDTDLVVSPAYCEPLGLFLLEAMNYGIPCIVSKQDGMPEIIEDKANGIVVEKPNSDQIAKEIIDLLSDNQRLKRMSYNAKQKVIHNFNWNQISNQIAHQLSNL